MPDAESRFRIGWPLARNTVPLSLYTGKRTAPGLIDFAQALGTFLVVVAGGADAHFTTPAGSEWGWRADGTFVNNLPGLQAVPILGSPTNSTRSIPILLPVAGGIPAIDIHMRDTNANVFHVDDTLPPGSTRPRSYRLHVVP